MSRWTILPVFLIGLPLIGCTATTTPPTPAASQTYRTGPKPAGGVEQPLVTVDQNEISKTREFSAADTLVHSSAWPIVTVTGPRAQ